MPYAFQYNKKKVPRELDRRVKITEDQKEAIRTAYHFEHKAQRQIARETGISRRMISFILFPERLEHNAKLYKERRKDGRYYDSQKHRLAMKTHRHYKQTIKDKLI